MNTFGIGMGSPFDPSATLHSKHRPLASTMSCTSRSSPREYVHAPAAGAFPEEPPGLCRHDTLRYVCACAYVPYKGLGLKASLPTCAVGLQKKREAIMQGVQQLLPLLFGSISSSVAAAVKDLKDGPLLESTSKDVADHLIHLQAAVEALGANRNVAESVARLQDSMVKLLDGQADTTGRVLRACTLLQNSLSNGLGQVAERLHSLVNSMSGMHVTVNKMASQSEQMLSEQSSMSAKLEKVTSDISECLRMQSCTFNMLSAATSPRSSATATLDASAVRLNNMLTCNAICSCTIHAGPIYFRTQL